MQGHLNQQEKALIYKAFLLVYNWFAPSFAPFFMSNLSRHLWLRKQKSYPTFANLDKIAEYFNATPTQLFGTSKEIELEKSVLESNEYSDKVSEILKAVKYIEHFLETDGQYLEDLLYLTRGNQLYTEDGDGLYIDPTSQKRTFHNQYEPGFIVARDKSPLELLIENKDLLDWKARITSLQIEVKIFRRHFL